MSPTRRAILRTSAAAVAALSLPRADTLAASPAVTVHRSAIDTSDMRPIGMVIGLSDASQGMCLPRSIALFDAGDGTQVLEYRHTSSLFNEGSRKWVTIHHSTSTATVTGPIDLGSLPAITHELLVAAGAISEASTQ